MIFAICYWILSRQGHCDSPGGMEYHRVRAEWIRAGRPIRMIRFIKYWANLPPGGSM